MKTYSLQLSLLDKQVVVNQGPFRIGRSQCSHLIIPETDVEPFQAVILFEWGDYWILDVGLKSRTRLNGRRIKGVRRLFTKGTLSFGETILTFIKIQASVDFSSSINPTIGSNLAGANLKYLGFTQAECNVIPWLIQGKRNEEISIILNKAPKTIEKHISRILSKLAAETRTAAVWNLLEQSDSWEKFRFLKDIRS